MGQDIEMDNGILPDWYFNHLSKIELKELIEFKKRVDEELKKENSDGIIKLYDEAKKRHNEEDEKKNYSFAKSFIFIINRNPLYLEKTEEKLKQLFKN